MDSTRLRLLALLAVSLVFLRIDFVLVRELVRVQPLGLDFLPVWTGVRFALDRSAGIYDFQAVTEAQQWLLGAQSKVRPFVYPPSAAVALAPLGFLPFWPAVTLFVAGSAGLFLAATWRASRSPLAVALVAGSPPMLLAVLTGQVSLLAGALAFWALLLERRPLATGAMLGVAAAIKPQLLLLFPLALSLERRWSALGAALGAGAVLCFASVLLVGAEPWFQWIAALPRFGDLVLADPTLLRNVVTPRGALAALGVHGSALLAAQAACGLVGVAAVALAFTRDTEPATRLSALIGGALLCSPYAMNYELALLAPAVAAAAARPESPRWAGGLLGFMLLSLALPGLVTLVGLMVCALQPWRSARTGAAA